MHRSDVYLLDLPDEILLLILKKLNNIDVLYSLLDINNERLDILAQEAIFSRILNFVLNDNTSLIDRRKLDRFCIDILPRIRDNVKCFILEPVLMERILLAADYLNLTELKLFNFDQEIARDYFTNESPLRYIFQQQITNLILLTNDQGSTIESKANYTRNVYAHILNFFKNLKHLRITETFIPSYSSPVLRHVPFMPSYPGLDLRHLPSTTFVSSILTHLYININTFDDCLYLLDGRLKQLTSLIVRIYYIDISSSVIHNVDDLPNLKCFSLKSYDENDQYDKITRLLRRMSYLEKLTLYILIKNPDRVIDGTHLQNEILVYMPRLHSFTFYICTYDDTGLLRHVSPEDFQRTFTNIGQQRVASILHSSISHQTVCSVFSLPFAFDRLDDIGNMFPNTVFTYVTHLLAQDTVSFNHEFFIRVARAFPLLSYFRIINLTSQSSCDRNIFSPDNSQLNSVVEYPYLTVLDLRNADIDCYEQFLNETKTYVPCLTELTAGYDNLRITTGNFTRNETRRNCAKVKELIMIRTLVHSKDFYLYFPSL